jgi:hypothetical protein
VADQQGEGKEPMNGTHTSRAAWLTPAFAWQVVSFIVVQIIAAIVAFQFLASDVRSSREEQARMRDDIGKVLGEISAIRSAIPNREALDERMRSIEKEIERLTLYNEKTEARWDNVNTRLSKSGM